MMSDKRILYAFVSDGEVKYIGKTIQSLSSRMYGYQKPGPTQTTNIRNHAKIKALLEKRKTVDIFALRDNGLLHYGVFHINLAAGLEDDLIAKLRPEWNGQALKGVAADAAEDAPKAQAENSEFSLKATSNIDYSIDSEEKAIKYPCSSFVLTLHKTYYSMGFFNVSVDYDRCFGNDLENIDIVCGNQPQLIVGYINRSANRNNAPRIMGGADLKRWFQQNSEVNGKFFVEIISPTSIKISVA